MKGAEPIGQYLQVEETANPGGKTRKWTLRSRSNGDVLGLIEWAGRWRSYVFAPLDGTIFSAGCLADIENFLSAETVNHKKAKALTGRPEWCQQC